MFRDVKDVPWRARRAARSCVTRLSTLTRTSLRLFDVAVRFVGACVICCQVLRGCWGGG
jgi:hypothetical protein